MPIAKKIMFKCENCGYMEARTIGDVLPDKEMLRPCPRCGGRMTMTDEEPESIIDKLKKVFGK